MENEIELAGRWGSRGVVRVGSTVRRPIRSPESFSHRVLSHLECAGFSHAPRFLGIDAEGREILTFIEGWVPSDLGSFSEHQFQIAARIIASFHRSTAGSSLVGTEEVVCHGDLSPCNFVFREELPVAIIDFDNCFAGPRYIDVGYAAWLWLEIGAPEREPGQAGEHLAAFFRAYGALPSNTAIGTVLAAQSWLGERCATSGRRGPQTLEVERWAAQCRAWVLKHQSAIQSGVSRGESAA